MKMSLKVEKHENEFLNYNHSPLRAKKQAYSSEDSNGSFQKSFAMLLIALLMFCKVLDNMDLKTLHENEELHAKIMNDMLETEESLKQGKIFEANAAATQPSEESGNLPPLVPFEFPADFYEKQGRKIIEAVEVKMGKLFGSSHLNQLKDFNSAEGMLDYLSNMDFNNTIVNFIVHKCIAYMKPANEQPLEGITDKKACRKACRNNLSTSIAFVHQVFQKFISQVTDEDLRFRIFQDPKKCFEYSFDGEKKEHRCKCVDKGYQVKVSPRLLEIVNSKFDDTRGFDLAEQLEKENSAENLTHESSYFDIPRKMGNLALYFGGFSSSSKSRWGGGYGGYNNNYYPRKDPAEFITFHFILNIFLFIFCHCLWYFHIVYFVLVFITEYVL